MSIKTVWKRFKAWAAGVAIAIASALGIYHQVQSQAPVWTVTMTLPNQYSDGSALALADLASATISYKVNGGAVQTKVVTTLTSASFSTTIPKALGQTCVNAFMTTTSSAVAPNTSSGATADVCVRFAGGPNTPTGLAVQ